MNTNRLSIFVRPLALSLSVLWLVGCAQFERQAFNAEAASHVKRINVTVWEEQTEYPARIINHPGASFGILGAVAMAADTADKTKKLKAVLDPASTKVADSFYSKTLAGLKAQGYEVTAVPVKRNEKRDDIIAKLASDKSQDAMLMLGIDAAYLAAGASTDYMPFVMVGAKLTDSKTNKVLYTEAYHYGYNDGNEKVVHLDAPPRCKFADIGKLTADAETTKTCLVSGVDPLVKQILIDLKK